MAELKLTIDANKALRDRVEVRTAERDAAVAHLRAVLDWSNTERFAGRTRHENDAPSSARSFLDGLDELQTSPKTSKDLDLCDECGCIGLCDPRCSLVPVQQDEPEGVCAFPNCSCTENRCPAKGERGPFCDHGFHPRLCGRCAPVPEAVTDEDEVQCQMCKTVQPRPDEECGHCGAGPKYLCPIHTRPAAVPVQQERSVRAPKTDDPHSLPRVDDLLDDIPVQQEPGRYSDRERVADYLASAQGVEFHDLNDDAQREWLMRASDALRAVWSIGRLVDADDGYEVMCEPVAAMVEDVRAALVPVQQDEPEDDPTLDCTDCKMTFGDEGEPYWDFCPPCRKRSMELLREPQTTEDVLAWLNEKRRRFRPVPVQQEPEERCDHDWIVETRTASIKVCQSCGMEQAKNMDDAVVGLCAAVPSVGLRDRVRDEIWRREWPEFTGTAEEVESDRHDRLSSLVYGVLSVLHEAGTQREAGPKVEGRCPSCHSESLRLCLGHVTCMRSACVSPLAADRFLAAEAGTQEDEPDSLSALTSDTALIREVARVNVELCDLSEKINEAVARWMDEAKRRKERLTASAVSGSPDTKDDEL